MSDAPIQADRALVLVEVEVTYGVDPTPAVATNALLPASMTLTPDINMITRGRHSPSYGVRGAIQGKRTWAYEITMPLSGSPIGPPVGEPDWGPLMNAANYSSTSAGGPVTSWTYAPEHKTMTGSCTIYAYMFDLDGDRELFILTGCRNNAKFNFSANGESTVTFTGIGIFNSRTNPADPGDGTWIDPDDFNILQSTAVTWGGRTDRFAALEIDLGWDVVEDLNVGSADSVVRVRLNRAQDGSCSGSYDPEDVDTATYDRLGSIAAETQYALAFVATTSGGSVFTFSAPAVQYLAPTPSSDNGMRRYDQPFLCADSSDAGDDYFTFVLTHP